MLGRCYEINVNNEANALVENVDQLMKIVRKGGWYGGDWGGGGGGAGGDTYSLL